MKVISFCLSVLIFGWSTMANAQGSLPEKLGIKTTAMTDVVSDPVVAASMDYTVGPADILGIDILEPDQISTRAAVSPDGTITAPFIGQVLVAGLTANQIRETIEKRLADGYLKFPSVMVSLLESHSRKFFVYGAVQRPGAYDLPEKVTVLRAISMAGGFTKFGSSSRVKVLRARTEGAGYETIKIKISDVMDGDAQADLAINNGDIIVISEGVF
ncbi:MAG: polysaccharide biosynthesis/export family protein [Candidatus Omnitrophica bacterium]|nr:polysaccharide biosynthesis/export family protein [Candidatus Omnitrophota bacterium]